MRFLAMHIPSQSYWTYVAAHSRTQGIPDPLNSTFHLSYNMVLNMLRLEGVEPESIIKRSFLQFQAQRALPAKQKGAQRGRGGHE